MAFALDMPDHQLGLSIDFTQSNTGVFARPYRVISVAALLVSNDYMLTKGFLARSLGDGNVLIITIFQVFTEYAAGSFLKHRSSKLRSNNQCYNTEILTQVKGHLDGSGGLYLKVARPHKQQQRPGK